LTAQQWGQEAKELEALLALQRAQEVKEDLVYNCTWLTFESEHVNLLGCVYL
jgi:hypothetical protein